jgi:putative IMPACT (imprinted ancient) family translation regulator
VVTRYFGGTKLGTGGLVRAYGDAVREVMTALPRAVRVPTHTVSFGVPYSLFERARMLVEVHHGEILEQDFGAQVGLVARFAVVRYEAFVGALRELSHGTVEAEIVETDEVTIVPLGALGIESP